MGKKGAPSKGVRREVLIRATWQVRHHYNLSENDDPNLKPKVDLAIAYFCKKYGLKVPMRKRKREWLYHQYLDPKCKGLGSQYPFQKNYRSKLKLPTGLKPKKGGAPNKSYHKYLLSPKWRNIRTDILNERGHNCEKCGEKKNLQIHHLTYKNIFNEKPEDLMILCRSCHRKEHGLKV